MKQYPYQLIVEFEDGNELDEFLAWWLDGGGEQEYFEFSNTKTNKTLFNQAVGDGSLTPPRIQIINDPID